MKPSIYIILASLQRHNALFHSKNESLKAMVIGTGIVHDPSKFNKSITGNKFRKNDVVLIVKAGKKDVRKYSFLFSDGEYLQIERGTKKEELDGSVVIPGIKILDRFDYLIKVGLEWGGQYLKARAKQKQTKKLAGSSAI